MKYKDEDPDNLGGLGDLLPAEVLQKVNELLEQLHWTDHTNQGSKIEFVYVASGAQHVENIQTQYVGTNPKPTPIPSQRGGEPRLPEVLATERISHCIALLMQEKYGNETLFNKQSHWQAVYRILVDKEYCRDSDFDGFDAFIQTVMPEKAPASYVASPRTAEYYKTRPCAAKVESAARIFAEYLKEKAKR